MRGSLIHLFIVSHSDQFSHPKLKYVYFICFTFMLDLTVAYYSIFDKINMARAYCHVSPARVEITRALEVNPKPNMAAAKKVFQFGLLFSKLLVNGCSPSRRVITGLPFNRCWSLGFRKRLFCPVNEVYRASAVLHIIINKTISERR